MIPLKAPNDSPTPRRILMALHRRENAIGKSNILWKYSPRNPVMTNLVDGRRKLLNIATSRLSKGGTNTRDAPKYTWTANSTLSHTESVRYTTKPKTEAISNHPGSSGSF
jgi:hypothetical protein